MANKKGKSANTSPLRSRTFTIELYPEWDNYKDILAHIYQFKHAYIVHDKDVNEETGEIKKEHAHVVIKYPSRRTLSSVKAEYKTIGVQDRFINTCNERVMLRYLIHADNLEKYQYSKDEVITNMREDFEKALYDEITPPQQLSLIIDFIESQEHKRVTKSEMTKFALRNNCYSALRSNGSLLSGIIQEHNNNIDLADVFERATDKVQTMYLESEAKRKKAEAIIDKVADKIDEAEITGFSNWKDDKGNEYVIYRKQ